MSKKSAKLLADFCYSKGAKVKYDKLIRDKLPEIILKKDGIAVKTHQANDIEFWEKLREKLVEEAKEFQDSGDIEELADVLEVIAEIVLFKKFHQEQIEKVKKDKLRSKGGFKKRLILEEA